MKKLLLIFILFSLLYTGCSSNGHTADESAEAMQSEAIVQTETVPYSETDPLNDSTDSESMAETEIETESDNQSQHEQEYINIISNDGELQIKPVLIPLSGKFSSYQSHSFDDRYKIYVTYEYDHTLNIEMNRFFNIHVYAVDILSGEIVFSTTTDDEIEFNHMTWYFHNSDIGCNIYCMSVENGEYVLHCGYLLEKSDSGFTLKSADCAKFPQSEPPKYTPDGQAAVYFTLENGYGAGGIDVKYPDGQVKRMLSNRVNDYSGEAEYSLGDVRGYYSCGFIDNSHFVYSITGYEWYIGYGICDITTGDTIEFDGQFHPSGTYGGAAYLISYDGENTYEPDKADIWKMTSDGEMTKIASTEESENTVKIDSDKFLCFDNGRWVAYHSGYINGISFGRPGEMIGISFYDPDFTQLLAQIEMPISGGILENCCIYENSVTAVILEKTE